MVVTSARKVEEIETLQKYAPKALSLYEANEETGKREEVFRIAMSKGTGSVTNSGICFAGATHDGQGLATVTLPIPRDVEDAKEYAADSVGVAVVLLNKVEAQFDAALAQVKTDRDQVMANITTM